MAITKPPSPEASTRSTSGGSGMKPPHPHKTTAPRSSSGGKGQAPPKPANTSTRSTKGAPGINAPQPDVPANEFVDPIATRPTPAFKPRSAK